MSLPEPLLTAKLRRPCRVRPRGFHTGLLSNATPLVSPLRAWWRWGVCRKVGGGSQESSKGLVWREEDLGGVRMRRERGERKGKKAGSRVEGTRDRKSGKGEPRQGEVKKG